MAKTTLLDPSYRRQIDQALLKVHRLLGQIDTIESCGVACDEFRAVLSYLDQQFRVILDKVFGVKNQ